MQSSSSARRAVLFAVVLVGVAARSRSGFAAPAAGTVTSTDRCSVSLVAVSYDDPGADDAEFIELRVDGLRGPDGAIDAGASACHGPMPPPGLDAATSMDANLDGAPPGPPTLGDCGMGELRLVDGGSGTCEEYRTIPLAAVAVPQDGYVVLCPAGSGVDTSAHCDVTAAGRSALRGGWLQNGPNDGLRFVDTTSHVVLEVSYEGALACFAGDATSLAVETGELGEPGTDDVNAVCDGRFVLLPSTDVPLRSAVRCPARAGVDAAAPSDAVGGRVVDGGAAPGPDAAAPWVPERAPAGSAAVAPKPPSTVLFDAGPVVPAKPMGALPSPPGCAVGNAARSRSGAPLLALFAAGLLRRRTRRSPAAPPAPRQVRERCGVRSGSGLRRSP